VLEFTSFIWFVVASKSLLIATVSVKGMARASAVPARQALDFQRRTHKRAAEGRQYQTGKRDRQVVNFGWRTQNPIRVIRAIRG
jgi:hypothetical protein